MLMLLCVMKLEWVCSMLEFESYFEVWKWPTNRLEDDVRPAVASAPYIMLLETLLTCCKLVAEVIASPGVWVDGGELGEGPVFPVPVLLAAPEAECCFLFLLFCNVMNSHRMWISSTRSGNF